MVMHNGIDALVETRTDVDGGARPVRLVERSERAI